MVGDEVLHGTRRPDVALGGGPRRQRHAPVGEAVRALVALLARVALDVLQVHLLAAARALVEQRGEVADERRVLDGLADKGVEVAADSFGKPHAGAWMCVR